MIVQNVQQTRGAGLGASQAASALGISPYLSPIGLYLQLKGKAESFGGAPAEWGQILEPVVRGYYAARHGYEIYVPTESMYHPELPWLRATPDGIVNGRHLVQIKTVDWRIRWHWGSPPSPPPHYRIQAVVEMAVTGLPTDDFAVLCAGNEYFECTVERDLELEGMVLEKLGEFWAGFVADVPPAIDAADEWRAYFADRLPKQRVEVTATASVEDLLDEWRESMKNEKAAKAQAALIKNKLLEFADVEQATSIASSHGRVPIVQPANRNPYVKAPASWGMEDE